jgi:hypothetical protein
MSLIMIAVMCCFAAVAVVAGGLWYAWHDYSRHPDRYGYRPGERQRRFGTPERGVTHQPVRRWQTTSTYPSADTPARPTL